MKKTFIPKDKPIEIPPNDRQCWGLHAGLQCGKPTAKRYRITTTNKLAEISLCLVCSKEAETRYGSQIEEIVF